MGDVDTRSSVQECKPFAMRPSPAPCHGEGLGARCMQIKAGPAAARAEILDVADESVAEMQYPVPAPGQLLP